MKKEKVSKKTHQNYKTESVQHCGDGSEGFQTATQVRSDLEQLFSEQLESDPPEIRIRIRRKKDGFAVHLMKRISRSPEGKHEQHGQET